ncbi:MAG: amino acid ABC transporter substrate-binding protein [Thermoproteales archaeon]|nr:amino acid ABC transporter substrate-binding protein [Thermoproteales archaeon]
MDTKVVVLIIISLLVGLVIGYAISLPEKQALQTKIANLESKLNPNYVQKIKSRGKLVVGTSADWPPFEYIDKNGNFAGIDIEIAKKIAQALGVQLEIKDMKFAALIESLKNGQVDLIIADITPKPEREQQIDFSIPYYSSKGYAVLVLKDSGIKTVEDLYGKKIGVQLGTIQEDWAKNNLGEKSEIKSYDRVYPDMVMVLKRGDVDALIVGDTIGEVLANRDPQLQLAFYAGHAATGGAVGMPQGAEDLKFVVNKVIYNMLESGEMENLFHTEVEKWLIKG